MFIESLLTGCRKQIWKDKAVQLSSGSQHEGIVKVHIYCKTCWEKFVDVLKVVLEIHLKGAYMDLGANENEDGEEKL